MSWDEHLKHVVLEMGDEKHRLITYFEPNATYRTYESDSDELAFHFRAAFHNLKDDD